jgi:hypothetical protein
MQMKQLLSKGANLQMGKWNNKRDKMEFLDASKTLKLGLNPGRHTLGFMKKVLQVFKSVGNGLENQFKSPMKRDAHY